MTSARSRWPQSVPSVGHWATEHLSRASRNRPDSGFRCTTAPDQLQGVGIVIRSWASVVGLAGWRHLRAVFAGW